MSSTSCQPRTAYSGMYIGTLKKTTPDQFSGVEIMCQKVFRLVGMVLQYGERFQYNIVYN